MWRCITNGYDDTPRPLAGNPGYPAHGPGLNSLYHPGWSTARRAPGGYGPRWTLPYARTAPGPRHHRKHWAFTTLYYSASGNYAYHALYRWHQHWHRCGDCAADRRGGPFLRACR